MNIKAGLLLSCTLFASVFVETSAHGKAQSPAPLFVEAGKEVLPLEDRSRRKWDTAIVADLDGDGLMDLILTEHGQDLDVYWNNGGTFSEPQKIVSADIHGQTVADYNRDGKLDLIIYPGGGGGKKPSNPVTYHLEGRTFVKDGTFDHFERCRGRVVKLVDVDNNGSLELLTTGFALQDTKQIQEGANLLYALDENQTYQFVSRLPHTKDRLGMRMLVTDYNNDGIFDTFVYGGKQIAAGTGGEGLNFSDNTSSVLGKLSKIGNVSSMVEIDYDNDGDFDLFLTRSEHPFEHRSSHDPDCGCFAFFSRFKPMEMDDIQVEGNLKVENLQTAYPHHDVMVGAEKRLLEFNVEQHGHKDFTLTPEEATGWPEDLTAKGLYIGYLGDQWWRIYVDAKSPVAAVIHNVVSTPATIPSEDMPAKLLENRDGVFFDVTESMGIAIAEQTTGSAIGDFDNDGWSDIFVVRYGTRTKPTEQIIYRNTGGKGFVRVENHGIISEELGSTGLAAEVFDYNLDGKQDIIYCNERGRWHLCTNQQDLSGNNHLIVRVGNSPSGKALALGACLTIHAGENTYKRIVGQTASSFGQNANNYLHVGLGSTEKIDSMEVRWTNGEKQTVSIATLNQIIPIGTF